MATRVPPRRRLGSKAQWIQAIADRIGVTFDAVKKWDHLGDFELRMHRYLANKHGGLPVAGRKAKK